VCVCVCSVLLTNCHLATFVHMVNVVAQLSMLTLLSTAAGQISTCSIHLPVPTHCTTHLMEASKS
jgi:hypothetical protein